MHVLIADDNHDLAASIAAVLTVRGARTSVCGDGTEALRLATDDTSVDVALVDLHLPSLAGPELLRRMSNLAPRPRLLAMTGMELPALLEAVERIDGVEQVFHKPFPLTELLHTLGLQLPPSSGGLGDAVVAAYAPGEADLGALEESCLIERFYSADEIREAVSDRPFDAAIVLGAAQEREALREDLKSLDRDLGVTAEESLELLSGAVERTRDRRADRHELVALRLLLDRSPSAMLVVDGSPPRIRYWNGATRELLGWRADELSGRELLALVDSDHAALEDIVAACRWRGTAPARVLHLRARDGGERSVRVSAYGAELSADSVCLTLAPTERGVSPGEALRLLGATAAGIAHELRNTLAGVGSTLEVIHGRLEGHEAAPMLGRVLDRVERAREVMNDLLAFARPITVRPKAIPALMVLKSAARQISETAPAGVKVVVDVPDPTLRIMVDPVRLPMALLNLGNNSTQALRGSGTIQLSCQLAAGAVQILVRDDGPGVPPGQRDSIFEPFFTTRPQGSGLGLPNTRKVVEAHGGEVELVPSERGAAFRIQLPLRLPADLGESR